MEKMLCKHLPVLISDIEAYTILKCIKDIREFIIDLKEVGGKNEQDS
jgi:hypothetical protein